MNRTKTIGMVAIFVLVTSFFYGCSTSNDAPPTTETGNSSGNITSEDIAARQGEWVYFNSGEGIYKEKPDGSERELILNANVSDINVVNDWIYFLWHTDGEFKLAKMKTDGTEKTILLESKSPFKDMSGYEYIAYFQVVGDWIYFLTDSTAGRNLEKLNRMKTDGSEIMVISGNMAFSSVVGDWIYYANTSDENKLYKVKTDGAEITKLNDEPVNGMNIYEDWIYYKNAEDDRIYKLNMDGTGKVQVGDDPATSFKISDGLIYYGNVNDAYKLYRMTVDGTEKIKISDEQIGLGNIVGDWIYYQNSNYDVYYYHFGTLDGRVYKMKTDGSENSVTVSAQEHVEDPEVTLGNFARYADALVGELGRTYDGLNYETGSFTMRIDSIETLSAQDGKTNVVIRFEGDPESISRSLYYFDEDGKRLYPDLFLTDVEVTNKTIVISSDENILETAIKYIVLGQLDPDKNNGKWIAVFEVPSRAE